MPNGNTRNLDATSMLTLNKDTGRGTFTIFVPNTAEDGDTIRIFVASGDMEQQIEVTFGEPGVTPGPDPTERDGFTADYTVTATSDRRLQNGGRQLDKVRRIEPQSGLADSRRQGG